GNPYMPTIKVTVVENSKTKTLTEGADYRILYQNNIHAGTGTVVVRGNGIYKGEIKQDFSITQKSIKKLKVITGSMAINDTSAPPIYVYDGNTVLKEGEDYIVSYAETMTATKGTKNVTITAVNTSNYTGSITVKVMVYDAAKIINPDNVELVIPDGGYTFTGAAKKPAVTVTVAGTTLTKRNYSVAYQNNKNAGTAYVIIAGKGGYKGKVVKKFTISAAESHFTVKKPITNKTYNGKLQKPAVVVMDGNKKLKAGKDYTLIYSNNLHVSTDSNKATITIKGKDNYADTSSLTVKFTILPQQIKKASVKGYKDALILTYNKKTLKENIDYTVTYGLEKSNKVETVIAGKGDFTGTVNKKIKIGK
nr:hypothetical protein [Lachnospiraceae bacterium]